MTDTQLAYANAKAIDANTVAIRKVDAKVEEIKGRALGSIRYDIPQNLTNSQKEQARQNIGADSGTVKSITVNGGAKQNPDSSGNVELKLNELLKDYTLDLNDSLEQRMEQLGEALKAAFGLVVVSKDDSSADHDDGQ